jgi:biotin synthase-related radical SAM superfamily protein
MLLRILKRSILTMLYSIFQQGALLKNFNKVQFLFGFMQRCTQQICKNKNIKLTPQVMVKTARLSTFIKICQVVSEIKYDYREMARHDIPTWP